MPYSDPSPSDFDRWEELLETGMEPSTAAKQLGFTCSRFRRANTDRHAGALTLSREARAHKADELAEEWATAEDASPHVQVAFLKRWQPLFRERHEVALTGADGGVLEVEIVNEEERASAIARKLAGLGLPLVLEGAAARRDPAEPAELGPAPAA